MHTTIHKNRTTTVATAARGRASTANAPHLVSRFLNDIAHYLMVPGSPELADSRGQQ
ncbi:hypothetical protein [Streptomyces lavendulae]|uniref:hypothetical protein n=1 Tax=Streptomyces lavendulae TaxID=1914 RepID=UPI00380BF012